MKHCPGVPLPPYVSALSLRSNMDYTALDEALPGSDIRRALEAAVLLDNELGVVPPLRTLRSSCFRCEACGR
jgi:hypothetical protein